MKIVGTSKKQRLPEGLEKRLAAYGAMAVAAALGGSNPANASVISWPGGGATTVVNSSVTFNMITGAVGTTDPGNHFALRQLSYTSSASARADGLVAGFGFLQAGGLPLKLAGGVGIGAGGLFQSIGILARNFRTLNAIYTTTTTSYGATNRNPNGFTTTTGFLGNWQNGNLGAGRGFLGLKFLIAGQTHFGWADITVGNGYAVTLHGFAYEACADQSILSGATTGGATCDTGQTPEPHSAALLALGAAGILAYRRRKAA